MPFMPVGTGRNPSWGQDGGVPPPSDNQQAMNNLGYPQQFGGMFDPINPCFYMTQQFPPGGFLYNDSSTPQPPSDPALSGIVFTNPIGGIGCQPGYEYIFPADHTNIWVFRTGNNRPWNYAANTTMPEFFKFHVSVIMPLGDLLHKLGGTNPNPKKIHATECFRGTNGRWYKGQTYSGNDDDRMKGAIEKLGWDKSRNGLSTGKPVVYLYISNS